MKEDKLFLNTGFKKPERSNGGGLFQRAINHMKTEAQVNDYARKKESGFSSSLKNLADKYSDKMG